MVAKRKKKTRIPQENLGTPSRWRLQHGDFTEPVREADPETGVPVLHRRAIDTLGQMLANGTITQEMHDAGGCFRVLFRRAALDGMVRASLLRLPGRTADALSERAMDARRRVAEALDALGGHDSPAGSCAWFVIGLEFSVREWAMRQGWAGRTVHGPVGQGILVGTLGTLAMHFGLTPRTKAA